MLGLSIPILISRIFTLAIAFTVHEFAHAWTADQLGDDTPRRFGRLSLNPLVHLDPLGSILLVATGFGWAKPVPINPYALRQRSKAGTMLVSAAGPFSNLILAIFASLPFQTGLLSPTTTSGSFLPTPSAFLQEFIFINLILLFFNLIPIAPLDGEKVAEYFLPPKGQEFLLRIRPYGPMILLGLLFILPSLGFNIVGVLVGYPTNQLFSLLVL
jgi:Zn-dependent protease